MESYLSLIAKDNVSEWQHRGHLIFEKLAKERCRQVEAVCFVTQSTVLGHLQHGVHGDCEEEAGGVDQLGGGHHGPVGLLLQVGDGEVVGGVQLGHQRPVLVGDQDSTPSSRLLASLIPVQHRNYLSRIIEDAKILPDIYSNLFCLLF